MFDKGLALWEAKKYDEAVQNFIALTTAYPNHQLVDDSLFWIANIYEHYLKEPKQAVRFYRSLTNTSEGSDYRLQSMLGLARVRAMEGDDGKRKAIRIYRKLQRQQDTTLSQEEWEQNQLRLAQLFIDLENYEQARVELKRLILERPNSRYVSKAHYQIGGSYQMEGKSNLAMIAYFEADKKFNHQKESIASAFNLADLYEEEGQLKEAINVYQSILNRIEQKEVFYQLANERIRKLKSRLKKTKTG